MASRLNGQKGGARKPPGRFERLAPQQFRANPEVTRRYRFVSTSGTARPIQVRYLTGAAGVVADTATTGQPIFQSVRIQQIEIWAPPASQGSAITCSVLWEQSTQSQPREVSDTSNSVSQPAHVLTSPPPGSLAGFWSPRSATTTLCTLVAPAGSIIDVWLSLVMGDGVQTSTPQTLVGATVGGVYYGGLDSQTAASAIYQPVSLTIL